MSSDIGINFLVARQFLMKIVGRESQDGETLSGILSLKLLQLLKAGIRLASQASCVDDQRHLTSKPLQRRQFAKRVFHRKPIDAVGKEILLPALTQLGVL
jgi:hypothetical protein